MHQHNLLYGITLLGLLGQLPGGCGQSTVSGAGAAPLLAGPAPDELVSLYDFGSFESTLSF